MAFSKKTIQDAEDGSHDSNLSVSLFRSIIQWHIENSKLQYYKVCDRMDGMTDGCHEHSHTA